MTDIAESTIMGDRSELPTPSEWQVDFHFRVGSRMSNSSGENNPDIHSVVPGPETFLGVVIPSALIAVPQQSLYIRDCIAPKARCQQCE